MANSSVLLLIVALVATVFGTVNGLSCNKCGIRTSNQFPNHPECASVPITNPKYFRDEEDCGKFYECNRGTAYEHVCSVGYAFNQQTTYCAPASKVNCSSQAPIASSSCTICQQAKESIHQHPNCRGGSEAHQRPVLFRHEKDCSKYYQCDHGTAYLVQCPAALHFNALTNVCDYPANVDCSGPVIQEQVDGAAGGYPGTNGHQGGRDPSNAPCTICEQATNVLVKHPNCNDNGRFYSPYFRHETDCSKFYQCSHGSAYEIQCPAGLNFNSRINVCDYPHNVDCSGSVIAQANEPSYPGRMGIREDRSSLYVQAILVRMDIREDLLNLVPFVSKQ
ncbi:hypothetical protein AND_008813 [Anopheles darlingi]|uniref:Chitin-binding type-2 domain-containing protein n=1 Tax=Anopheles darlingi TaxID=43151 RepID=W5JA06_ANODA|nr:hypothetical protein AND_008813 [Anopheles darlingi]